MVRRAAAFRLGKFADTVEPEIVSKEIIPLFQDLTQDGMLHAASWCHLALYVGLASLLLEQCALDADQDSVRLLAVETCGPLARLLNKSESVQHVLPIVQKFAQVGSTPARLSSVHLHFIAGQASHGATNWCNFSFDLVQQAACKASWHSDLQAPV